MDTKKLGQSDLHITPIGIGAWAIGGTWEWGWGDQDDTLSIKTIHHALASGINWVDTAAIYGLGHSEEVVGKALKLCSEKPYIFTKCSLIWDQSGKISNSLRGPSICREVEASLRRLNVEIIDLYQIHWPNPDTEIEEGWETLAKLQEQGKVRYIGVSNFSVSQMQRVQDIATITSLQPLYNLIHREVEKDILIYCLDNNIGVIVYSPMASGLLTGKMSVTRVEQLSATDWRRKSDDYKEPQLSKNLAIQDKCIRIGKKYGCSAAEIAIAWTLENQSVTGAIVGMRSPEQVNGIIRAPEIQLTNEDRESLEQFTVG